jgi:flagellar biosynthesis/type III secretory pathway protein FliH
VESAVILEDFALSGVEALEQSLLHQRDFSALRKQIRQEGYSAGYADGHRDAAASEAAKRRALVDEALVGVESLFNALKAERRRFAEANAEELVQLALAIGSRLARVALRLDPQALEEKLRICLQQLDQESAYLVRVNPGELAALQAVLAESGQSPFGTIPFRLVEDRRVPPGGLILDSERGRVESVCADELARIEELLTAMIRNEARGDEP